MTPGLHGRRFGPDAWLLQFGTQVDAATFRCGVALRERLEARPPVGLVEWIPSFTTLLCRFAPETAPSAPGWWKPWDDKAGKNAVSPTARRLDIPVRYDGEDLGHVARKLGLSVAEVVRRHLAGDYFVHCLGFAPGFPYLGGLDPVLRIPRRENPRPCVAAGSVAIGGEHAGIYTLPSPGGWHLLGRTSLRLFDPGAGPEARFRLRAGDAVRFVETSENPTNPGPTPAPEETARTCLRVLASGTGLSVQDGGRPGWARFGVPPGGAMDPVSMAGANRLVDNPADSPALELLLGRQELRAETEVVLGLAGADLGGEILPVAGGPGQSVEPGRTIVLHPGDRLRFRGGPVGVWAYLAVPGGIVSPVVMESAGATPRAGLGTVFTPGDLVRVQDATAFHLPAGTAGRRLAWDSRLRNPTETRVRVWPGPQSDAFSGSWVRRWFASEWKVSPQSDRVGYRLDGEPLCPPDLDLISEPVLPGSVQVPPGGQPIVTMPDGPTMGGYPKLALVDPADLRNLAQAGPGSRVRFVPMPNTGWAGEIMAG